MHYLHEGSIVRTNKHGVEHSYSSYAVRFTNLLIYCFLVHLSTLLILTDINLALTDIN